MALIVGQQTKLTGNVTTLGWIAAREPALVEQSLGYGGGRLSDGYCIALLKEPLQAADFEFEGTTLRSGGRLGNPASTPAADQARTRVHQTIDPAQYKPLQQRAIAQVKLAGDDRIAKVLPMKPHSASMAPDLQYPPGAGGLQWRILPPGKRFLIAVYVDPGCIAHSLGFSLDIGPRAPYANRAEVMKYLRSA